MVYRQAALRGGDAVTFEIDRGACLQVIDRKEVILGEVQTCGGSYYLPRVKSSISACIPLCVHHSIFPFSVSRNPLTLSPSTRYADRSFPGNVADIFERFFDNKNPPEKSVWRKMIFFSNLIIDFSSRHDYYRIIIFQV